MCKRCYGREYAASRRAEVALPPPKCGVCGVTVGRNSRSGTCKGCSKKAKRADLEYRTAENAANAARLMERYNTDAEFRERQKAANRERSKALWASPALAQAEKLRQKEYRATAKSRAYQLEYKRRPEHRAKARYTHSGMCHETVLALRKLQQGKCALCSVLMEINNQRAPHGESADHAETEAGKVPRGLLCRTCNLVLGNYETHQRPHGLSIAAYEAYLSLTPVQQLESK